METKIEALKGAVASIKAHGVRKGITITEEEMAGKAGISAEQLQAYLNGGDEVPADLPTRLRSACDIRIGHVQLTSVKQLPVLRQPEDEPAIRERNRQSLNITISLVRKLGAARGVNITEEEIAGKLDISPAQLQAYLDDRDRTPDNSTHRLRTVYADLLDAMDQENNRDALAGILVWIRNLGLAGGMNITLEQMARRADITTEQLYRYLDGDDKTPGDLYFRLRDAYRDLLENVERVEVIEDIHMIMASGRQQ
jgi:transcriptional regulator with XRE-family HTH domain